MKTILLLCLLAVGLLGCSRDLNLGEVCIHGFKYSVMEHVDRHDRTEFRMLTEVVTRDGKSVPCPEWRP